MGHRCSIGNRSAGEASAEGAPAIQGEIDIAAEVVTRIAETILRETHGLRPAARGPRLSGVMSRIFGQRATGEGVRARIHQDVDVTLDLWIAADFGIDIPAAVAHLRERLVTSISDMTGFRTRMIRVKIVDLVVSPDDDSSPALK